MVSTAYIDSYPYTSHLLQEEALTEYIVNAFCWNSFSAFFGQVGRSRTTQTSVIQHAIILHWWEREFIVKQAQRESSSS